MEEILAASRETLVRTWRELHGSPPPRSISQPLLRRILAFDLQLRAEGGWPAGLEERIARAGQPKSRAAPASPPLAGGRLLREWNGVTHVVEVTGDGYRWQGREWRSLSAIARAITGVHWSGPRFFGLSDEKTASKARPAKGGGSNRSGATRDVTADRFARVVRCGRAGA